MISAKIIADSVGKTGVRITTMELEYPRFIHAEFMTHRMFSRNAASSRAIPVEKARQKLIDEPAMPIRWGANQSGMQAKMADINDTDGAQDLWLAARWAAIEASDGLAKLGLHKQWCNRLTEPFSHIKVVVTSTEWDNFYALRLHPDAQPEIMELARVMKEAHDNSDVKALQDTDWHVPYYHGGVWRGCGDHGGERVDQFGSTLGDALAISASCCAQVSYRTLDDSLEKAKKIFERLIVSEPMHASPFEHQATPIPTRKGDLTDYFQTEGFTHRDVNGIPWSANFRGWIQYRQRL